MTSPAQPDPAYAIGATTIAVLPGEDPAEHERLMADHLARHRPADSAELFWVGQVVLACWRLRRLQAVEARAFVAGAGAAAPDANAPPPLTTLARYAGRIERDARHAEQRLAALVAKRPAAPASLTRMDALQLRWLADRIDAKAARGMDEPAAPEPAAPPAAPPPAAEATRTDEPGIAAAAPAPNRAARRRLAALARKRGGAAAAA